MRDPDTRIGGAGGFPSTELTLVQGAAGSGAVELEEVARIYWKPVYRHIRLRWRKSNEDAKDLTQGFFAALLDREWLARFDPVRGSFRNYLRVCADGFVAHANERDGRVKRGGGILWAGVDFASAEPVAAGQSALDPEQAFHRAWQREVFRLAVDELRERSLADGRRREFEVFERHDLCEGARPSYAELARLAGTSETTITNWLAGRRRELRRLVLERVERSTPAPFDRRVECRDVFR